MNSRKDDEPVMHVLQNGAAFILSPLGIVSVENACFGVPPSEIDELYIAKAVINWLTDIYINPSAVRTTQ